MFINLWISTGEAKYNLGDTLQEKHVYMYETLLTDKSSHIHR